MFRSRWIALIAIATVSAPLLSAGAQSERHGRKYAPPPPTTHISVRVTKQASGKPIANAEVIFHPLKDGKDTGSMEIKTNHEGVAELDILPQNSQVRLQVIAEGFRTFGQDYELKGDSQDIDVKLDKPAAQISDLPGTTIGK